MFLLAALVVDALTLGLEDEAHTLQDQLSQRQAQLSMALQQAAAAGSATAYQRLLDQVGTPLGLYP